MRSEIDEQAVRNHLRNMLEPSRHMLCALVNTKFSIRRLTGNCCRVFRAVVTKHAAKYLAETINYNMQRVGSSIWFVIFAITSNTVPTSAMLTESE